MGKSIDKIYINIDGACRGNPGNGAIGVVVKNNGDTLEECSELIGHTTNNRAEYMACKKALEIGMKHCRRSIHVFSDSELLIKQLSGEYRVKQPELRELLKEIKQLEAFYSKVIYSHIRRDRNNEADKLANSALKRV